MVDGVCRREMGSLTAVFTMIGACGVCMCGGWMLIIIEQKERCESGRLSGDKVSMLGVVQENGGLNYYG